MLHAVLSALMLASPAEPSLAQVLPAKDKLPACASLYVPPPGVPAEGPCGATGNPYVSREDPFVVCLGTVMLGLAQESGLAEPAGEAAVARYQSGGAMAVLAVSLKKEEAATSLAASLQRAAADAAAKPGQQPRVAVLRNGGRVGFAVCDTNFDDACCQQMLTLIKDLWKKP